MTTGIRKQQRAGGDGGPLDAAVPEMVAMLGGAVRAVSLVNMRAKAYSFQAKIRQKTAVAAMPVTAAAARS